MSAYTNHGKITSAKRRVGENEHWQKVSSYIKKDCFEKSQNYCNIGDSRTEYPSEDPVSTKNVECELLKSNTHHRAAIAKPLITESNSQMCKQLCQNHKTWTSANWKHVHDMVRWVVLHTLPYIREEFTFGEHPRNPTTQNACLVLTVKRRDGSVMVWAAISWYSFGPIINLHSRTTAREYVNRLGNQVHPTIQMLFLNNDAVFQDDCAPSHSWNHSVMVWRAWRWTSTSSLASIIIKSEHHWTTLVNFGD
jgi:hypothetical protein